MISISPLLLLLIAVMVVAVAVALVALVLVFFWRRAETRNGKAVFAIFLLLILSGPVSIAFFTGFVGNSRARIERDHSLVLPPSISNIRCDGFVSLTTFLDSRACASFRLSRKDLDAFLPQFSTFRSSPSIPADWPDFPNGSPAWRSGRLMAAYTGKSMDGNVQWMEIRSIDPNSVGICLVTQWN